MKKISVYYFLLKIFIFMKNVVMKNKKELKQTENETGQLRYLVYYLRNDLGFFKF